MSQTSSPRCSGTTSPECATTSRISSVAVRLEEPGALPRSEGKYTRVYDLR